jgi:two-component system cell cycle response regulator
VSTLRQTLRELSSTLRDRPDEIVLNIGAGGELLVARFRLTVTLVLMLLPLINFLAGGSLSDTVIGLAVTGFGTLLALVWLMLAKQQRRFAWLPFVTSASDITMETLVMVLIAVGESPAASLNSVIVWCCYPISIFATSLRNDGRVTLFTGLLAVAQYGLLIVWVYAKAAGHPLASVEYGEVSLSNEIQRLVLLVVATLLTAVVVYRIQRLVMLSGTDTLTGLPNRSYLVHRVPQLIEESRKGDTSITLAIIDLDYFKRINDLYGHPVGDRALRHVVVVLRNELAEDEALMRVGGEEFVLIMRRSMGPAWERMEALRKKVASTPFKLEEDVTVRHGEGGNTCTLTFSAGLASCPVDALDMSHLLRRADQRLIKAKQGGRNRVVARE